MDLRTHRNSSRGGRFINMSIVKHSVSKPFHLAMCQLCLLGWLPSWCQNGCPSSRRFKKVQWKKDDSLFLETFFVTCSVLSRGEMGLLQLAETSSDYSYITGVGGQPHRMEALLARRKGRTVIVWMDHHHICSTNEEFRGAESDGVIFVLWENHWLQCRE